MGRIYNSSVFPPCLCVSVVDFEYSCDCPENKLKAKVVVRTDGDWESWVSFFLEGVASAAADAEKSIIAVASLVAADRRRLLQSPEVAPAIVMEMTGQKKNRSYSYRAYIELLSC